MLSVYRFNEPYTIRLRIEGALTADALATLEQWWDEAIAIARGRKLALDASALTRADALAIAFLHRLRASGATVDDNGRFLPAAGSSAALMTRVRHGICAALCAAMPSLHRCPCAQRL
jgi:hypothetical protein